MIATTFRHARDNSPAVNDVDWPGLVALVGTHRTIKSGDKRDAPAFSPAEYPERVPRSKANVRAVHFAVLDVDKVTQAEHDEVFRAAEGLAAIYYTTFSHAERHAADGTWSFRLVLPFTRPVLAKEWPAFWPRMNEALGGHADPQCKDPSRIYFLPSAQAPDPSVDLLLHVDGNPLDVDALLALPEPIDHPATHVAKPISTDDLADLASRLVRKSSHHLRSVAHAIRHALKGEPFAPPGARDDALFKVACAIAEEWPTADAKQVAEHFRGALGAMAEAAPECPTVDDLEEKIRRKQDDVAEENARQAQAEADAMSERISESFGTNRTDPYSDDELKGYASAAGCTVEKFRRRWIVQAKSNYYLFHDGSYGPALTKDELVLAAETRLAPAHAHGVSIYRRTPDGDLKAKQPQDLVLDYGSHAENVVADFTAMRSYYDNRTKTIVEAPTPLRDIAPQRYAEIEEWLNALGWENHDRLLDWVAAASQLDMPCAALYLHGPRGCGKTLFAHGISRLWTTHGATSMDDAVADFNEAVLQCPLVFADERVPKKLLESGGTGMLREMVQAHSRTLNRKFKPPAKLLGTVRIIFAANNMNLLESDEMLTPDDAAALAERILYLEIPQAAADTLKRFDPDVVKAFVKEDALAAHALWLRDTRQLDRRHRFLVSGVDSAMHRNLTTHQGLNDVVCQWLVEYLAAPTLVDANRDLLIRIHKGQLLVTARGIANNWDAYLDGKRGAPRTGRIGRVLKSLCEGKRQLPSANGKATNYWVVRTEVLRDWNKDGDDPWEVMEEALSKDTVVDGMGVDNVIGLKTKGKGTRNANAENSDH